MKTCLYSYTRGLYQTECGGKTVARPMTKCDRCGRKPEEVAYAADQEGQEDKKIDDRVLRKKAR